MPTGRPGLTRAGDSAGLGTAGAGRQVAQFGILGPLEVRIGGRPIDLGGPKQRALLAVLLLHLNQAVSTERLIGELWDQPPATAQKSVQVYVSRLRRLLVDTSAYIETTPAGYVLSAGHTELDVQMFEALAIEGRAARDEDAATASARFRGALALWRGAPLEDLASEPFTRVAIPRLEERRLSVLEEAIEADLTLGRHAGLVGDLYGLVADNPFRERLYAHLMVALYRSGRQAEALEVYQHARARLRDELGIEPGPDLQRLQAALLRQDPTLLLPGPVEPGLFAPDGRQRAERHSLGGPDSATEPPTHLEPDPGAASRRERSPRRRVLAAVAGVALATAAIGVALAIAPANHAGSGPVVVRANSVAIVDAVTGSLVGDIPTGTRPGPIAIAGGAAWVGNNGDLTLQRIDLRTRTVVRTIGLSQTPVSLTAGRGVLWIGNAFDGTLTRVLTPYDQLSAPFFPGPPIAGMLAVAASPGDLWLGLADSKLLRLDPASLRTKATIAVPGRVREIAVTRNAVWTLQWFSNSVDRIDPLAGRVTAIVPLPGRPVAIAAGDGSIWVATSGDDQLWRIAAVTGRISGSFPLGVTPSAIAVQPRAVWVAAGSDGIVERVNSATGTIVPLTLGHTIGGLAIADGDIWLTAG